MAVALKVIAATVILAAPVAADDFNERWPAPVSAEPIAPVQKVAAKPKRRAFHCARHYYTEHHHRYWECR